MKPPTHVTVTIRTDVLQLFLMLFGSTCHADRAHELYVPDRTNRRAGEIYSQYCIELDKMGAAVPKSTWKGRIE